MISPAQTSKSPVDGTAKGSADLAGYASVVGLVVLITLFAGLLNQIFYKHNGPFYDGLSYLNHMNWVMVLAQHGRIADALKVSLSQSTVLLPWLQAIALSYFVAPTRLVGILIQSVWLMVLGLSVYHYLTVVRKLDRLLAFAFTIPFIAPARVFAFDGGLSDFRMDLIQYALLSSTGAFFFSACETRRKVYWILAGSLAGLSCLGRSTSLVYLSFIYVPLLAVAVFRSLNDRPRLIQLAKGASLMGACFLACCAWYYIANAAYLKYYYFLWNTHANSRLPLARSLRHVLFLALNLGYPWLVFCLLAFGKSLWSRRSSGMALLKEINWGYLWAGFVPCAFLVVLGAGPNQIVSLPSVFGLVLFSLQPLFPKTDPLNNTSLRSSFLFLFGACLCLAATALPAIKAARQGLPDQIASMPALKRVEDTILFDMKRRNCFFQSVSAVYCQGLNNGALIGSFAFDRHYALDPDKQMLSRGDIKIAVDESLEKNAELDWQAIAGKTDKEKAETLARQLLTVCYLIVPADSSLSFIQKSSMAAMNSRIVKIKRYLMESGALTRVGDPIALSPYESVIIYRNDRLHPLR